MNKKSPTLILALCGILIIIVAEVSILFKLFPLNQWVTPLCWWGYLLIVDSILARRGIRSIFLDKPRIVYVWLLLSLGLWLIFEGYNLILKNWQYVGVPEARWVYWTGCAVSFASIIPSLFLTARLWNVFFPARKRFKIRVYKRPWLAIEMTTGLLMLILPLIFQSPLLVPFVWLGWIFFLDPINYYLGNASIIRDIERGERTVFFGVLVSGLICGFLWEFWNYWAGARWVYYVPFLPEIKIFEMPVLGFLGFPPFALEMYCMYHFCLGIMRRLGLSVADYPLA